VGIVTNGYWAQTLEDALVWLQPLAGKLEDLSVSCDLFHFSEEMLHQAQNVVEAAEQLGISVGTISVAQPEDANAPSSQGQLESEAGVMFRGRENTHRDLGYQLLRRLVEQISDVGMVEVGPKSEGPTSVRQKPERSEVQRRKQRPRPVTPIDKPAEYEREPAEKEGNPNFKFIEQPSINVGYLAINTQKPILNNKLVRQAMCSLLLVEALLLLLVLSTISFVHQLSQCRCFLASFCRLFADSLGGSVLHDSQFSLKLL
jgi:hypothetical protein